MTRATQNSYSSKIYKYVCPIAFLFVSPSVGLFLVALLTVCEYACQQRTLQSAKSSWNCVTSNKVDAIEKPTSYLKRDFESLKLRRSSAALYGVDALASYDRRGSKGIQLATPGRNQISPNKVSLGLKGKTTQNKFTPVFTISGLYCRHVKNSIIWREGEETRSREKNGKEKRREELDRE